MPVGIFSCSDNSKNSLHQKLLSKYLVVVLVTFDNLDIAEETNNTIGLNKASDEKVILKLVSKHNFKYRALVVELSRLRKEKLPDESLYMFITNQFLLRSNIKMKNIPLFVHQNAQSSIKGYSKYIQSKLGIDLNTVVGPLKKSATNSNHLLLLAEIICNAIYLKFDKGDNTLHRLIKKKEEDLWESYSLLSKK